MKLKHRSSLKLDEWVRDGYFFNQAELCDRYLRNEVPGFVDSVPRVHVDSISNSEFIERYEKGSRPVIITGVTEQWAGFKEWQPKRLIKKFGNSLFKIGESDSGRKLKVTLREYMEYMIYGRDDSPLYLFESSLEDHPQAKDMLKEYKPPKFFNKNLFAALEEDEMPPHRWFLIGPKRSGTEIHQDPLGTSAWNASVMGHKLWILIEPGPEINKKLVRGRHLLNKGEDDEAIHYFDYIFPRLKAAEGHRLNIMQCIQRPGETIFVPGTWWHAVLNLDDTIAITENFCNEGNFDRVWLDAR